MTTHSQPESRGVKVTEGCVHMNAPLGAMAASAVSVRVDLPAPRRLPSLQPECRAGQTAPPIERPTETTSRARSTNR